MGKKTDIAKVAAAPEAETKPAVVKKPAAKKPTAKSKAASVDATATVVKPKKAVVSKTAFTHDDIALRAYFIAEKRHKTGLPGDSQHDWVEAERQLTAESKKKKPAAKSA